MSKENPQKKKVNISNISEEPIDIYEELTKLEVLGEFMQVRARNKEGSRTVYKSAAEAWIEEHPYNDVLEAYGASNESDFENFLLAYIEKGVNIYVSQAFEAQAQKELNQLSLEILEEEERMDEDRIKGLLDSSDPE